MQYFNVRRIFNPKKLGGIYKLSTYKVNYFNQHNLNFSKGEKWKISPNF